MGVVSTEANSASPGGHVKTYNKRTGCGVPETNKNSYIVRLGSWRMVVGWGKWYPLGLIHPVCGFLIKCLSGETVDAELPARFEGSHIKRENK